MQLKMLEHTRNTIRAVGNHCIDDGWNDADHGQNSERRYTMNIGRHVYVKISKYFSEQDKFGRVEGREVGTVFGCRYLPEIFASTYIFGQLPLVIKCGTIVLIYLVAKFEMMQSP